MFKKIKNYFAEKKKKKHLQKLIEFEVLETIRNICFYLNRDSRRTDPQSSQLLYSNYISLEKYTKILREEIITEEREKRGNRKWVKENTYSRAKP